MDIREVKDYKKQYIDLLLLADEQEDMGLTAILVGEECIS